MITPETQDVIRNTLQQELPGVMGIYAFGSRVQGTANAQSDLDLAVLVAGYAPPLVLWELSNQLANRLGYEVDLLDLRAASTVMQYQVITTGVCLFKKDLQTDLYETYILREKLALDSARKGILDDIKKAGNIYGR